MDNLEFVSEQQKQWFEEARLGIEFESFLKGNVGRHLQGRAIAQYEEAKEQLLTCNSSSYLGRRRIKKYQQQAIMSDNFLKWCADAIKYGREAEALLNEE